MTAMLAMDPGEKWMVMLHGFAFLTFNRQSGPSGGEDFESQNHLMTAALHRLWGGKLSFFGTFSLEPATIPRGILRALPARRDVQRSSSSTASIRTTSSPSSPRSGSAPCPTV
jgi:hypothetical protein